MNLQRQRFFETATGRKLAVFAGGLIGLILYFVFVGPAFLNVQNIDWLLRSDPGAHYLAWSFFRQEPWTFPLGGMYLYGVELASTIVFADAIPLVAIPLKLFSHWLPADFQYFGWWTLACFVMQGIAAVLLLRKFSDRIELQLLGAAFFVLQPVILYRYGYHFALMGQWVITLAFVLFFSSARWRMWILWAVLLITVAMIHAYLLAMVLVIFGFWSLRETMIQLQGKSVRRAVLFLGCSAAVMVVLLLAMASVDYFRPMGLGQSRFREFSANLLGWVMPTAVEGLLIPTHRPAYELQFEGFWYLGAGVLFLMICGVLGLIFCRRNFREVWLRAPYGFPALTWASFFILLLAFLLWASALSLNFGSIIVFEIPLPQKVEDFMNIFRACGRFAWPLASGLLLLALLATRGMPRWAAVTILCIALPLQIADIRLLQTSALASRVEQSGITEVLQDPRWQELVTTHEGISVLPNFFWRFVASELDLGLLAARNKKKIDAAYYARYPAEPQIESRWQRHHDLWRARPDTSWIYVIHQELLARKNLAAWKSMLPAGSQLLTLDHYFVAIFPESEGKNSSVIEWPESFFAAPWPVLSAGFTSFHHMGEKFDRFFLGGFYPDSRGAMLSYDFGVAAFHLQQDVRSLELKLIPENIASDSKLRIQVELWNAGSLVAEREIFLEPGWTEQTVNFDEVKAGDFILRMRAFDWHKKSEQWRPKPGGSVILVDAVVE